MWSLRGKVPEGVRHESPQWRMVGAGFRMGRMGVIAWSHGPSGFATKRRGGRGEGETGEGVMRIEGRGRVEMDVPRPEHPFLSVEILLSTEPQSSV